MRTSTLPACERDVADAVADAARDGVKLAIAGGASTAGFGRPVEARRLPMAGLNGIVDYDPAELVLTARPGTPLANIQALVAENGQMLAFDPFDHGPIHGRAPGQATIGGIVAAGVSGSQRISAGAARDHLLGLRAVSGRGEVFQAGGKVVKNVTGYDLPKLAAGSWGRLFAITELTLKVLPRPQETATLAIEGLTDEAAVATMAAAMGSRAEVSAAAHVPAGNGAGVTILRVQGFGASVAARCAILVALLEEFGPLRPLPEEKAEALWHGFKTLHPLGGDHPLWRISVPPSRACQTLSALRSFQSQYMLDWAGGLIWMATDAPAETVRNSASEAGGHAVLVRAEAAVRAHIPPFHPPAPGVGALEERIRRAFDPAGLFETGRF